MSTGPIAKLDVKVTPRASRDEVVGWREGVLSVRVTAAPEGGKANAAVEALLAAAVGVRKTAVRVASGRTARRKRIEIDGLDRAELERRLAEL